MEIWTSLVAACFLAAVHLFAGHALHLRSVPRSRWLSAAGGVSIAYVFLHLLPGLAEEQGTVELLERFLDHPVYMASLLGLAAFYGLERAAVEAEGSSGSATPPGVFWLHIGSFTLYNVIIGYLLVQREAETVPGLVVYAAAIGLHFVVNDASLREHHEHRYAQVGRWLLAGAVLLGWALAALATLPGAALALAFAFLAGGIVLNVLKEELPEERESRFGAFLTGIVAYAALLQIGTG